MRCASRPNQRAECRPAVCCRLRAMSTTNRPAAMATQPTTTLNNQYGAALGAARGGGDDRGPPAGDQDLAFAAAVPIDRDALAAELVGELIGGLDVVWCGV